MYLQFLDSVNCVIERVVQNPDGSLGQSSEPRSFTRGQGLMIEGITNGVIIIPGGLINGIDPTAYQVLTPGESQGYLCCN